MVRGFTELLSALFTRGAGTITDGLILQDHCLVCGVSLEYEALYQEFRVCPDCRFHYGIPARKRIDLLVDPKSFKEQYKTISSLDPLSFSGKVTYRKRLFRDQKRTGLTEAAIVGYCKIGGIRSILILLDFSFMGGSIGCVVGEKIALAFERAIRKRLPVVAVVTSGGARIQEGVLSLMQMAKTTMAVDQLHQMGLPYITVFANPTTGQSYASFANLADITLAEPGALVGFAPLRLLQEMADEPLPVGSHTAESHVTHGMVDYTVDRESLPKVLSTILHHVNPQRTQAKFLRPKRRKVLAPKAIEAWEAVQRVRRPDRPTVGDFIDSIFPDFIEIHGDRLSGDDSSIKAGIAELQGCSVVIIGQQRQLIPGGESQSSYITPHGFRKAQRAMRLASKFNMPLLTLIDTAGPSMGIEAEEGGIGHALASTMALMGDLPVPTVAAIVGEGGREAALAFGIADRVIMLENAIYTPISPEGAASFMYRDDSKTQEAAQSLRLTSRDALDMKIINEVVLEPDGGAHLDPTDAAKSLEQVLIRNLAQIQTIPITKLLRQRYKKFRKMGEYTSYFRATLAREIETLQSYVVEQVKSVREKSPSSEKNLRESQDSNRLPSTNGKASDTDPSQNP